MPAGCLQGLVEPSGNHITVAVSSSAIMHGTFYWRSVYGDLMASALFGRAIFAHAPRAGRMAQSLLLLLSFVSLCGF